MTTTKRTKSGSAIEAVGAAGDEERARLSERARSQEQQALQADERLRAALREKQREITALCQAFIDELPYEEGNSKVERLREELHRDGLHVADSVLDAIPTAKVPKPLEADPRREPSWTPTPSAAPLLGLPDSVTAEAARTIPTPTSAVGRDLEPSVPPTSTPRVLVVDDDEAVRESFRDILAEHGYVVVTARDGWDATAAIFRMRRVDLVLLDLMMPVVNGLAFANWLATTDEFAHVPVVIISAGPYPAEWDRSRYAFVSKPAQMEQLLAIVREHVK